MKVTQADRDAYRYALEDTGVPEVIAFMAARNANNAICGNPNAGIDGGFVWSNTKEGFDFWSHIDDLIVGAE